MPPAAFKDKSKDKQVPKAKKSAAPALKNLRGIGPAMLEDFELLGIRSIHRLARSDGEKLYRRLAEIRGVRQDPCVLDTFRCAVAQARNPHLPEEQKNWWYWSRVRKGGSQVLAP